MGVRKLGRGCFSKRFGCFNSTFEFCSTRGTTRATRRPKRIKLVDYTDSDDSDDLCQTGNGNPFVPLQEKVGEIVETIRKDFDKDVYVRLSLTTESLAGL